MKNTAIAKFIMETMMLNPEAKIYWDASECHFIMETRKGQHYKFRSSHLKICADSAQNIYYVDENNCRIYLLYLVYVD